MSPSQEDRAEAIKFKNKGNAAFRDKRYLEAVAQYTAAIKLSPEPAFYSNRAFAYQSLESYQAAVEDSTKAIEQGFRKAYYRRGTANFAQLKFREALFDFQFLFPSYFRQAERYFPSDPVAKKKSVICKKRYQEHIKRRKLELFRSAISRKEEVLKWSDISLPRKYDLPKYESKEVSREFVTTMVEHMKQQGKVPKRYVVRVLSEISTILSEEANMLNVEMETMGAKKFTICGDTHGQFYDLLYIFEENGFPSKDNPYLFNGDFVDRGSWSFEVIFTLFLFKLLNPNHFFLTRGNHETISMNSIYGFKGEILAKFDLAIFNLFTNTFDALPLCAKINDTAFVVHGGLPEDAFELREIQKIDRKQQPANDGLMTCLLWSDPTEETETCMASARGCGVRFGRTITEAFLKMNSLKFIVRSHEMKEKGYDEMHNGMVRTIFSCPNYVDQAGNLGAYLVYDANMNQTVKTFKASKHPNIRAMHYASQMF